MRNLALMYYDITIRKPTVSQWCPTERCWCRHHLLRSYLLYGLPFWSRSSSLAGFLPPVRLAVLVKIVITCCVLTSGMACRSDRAGTSQSSTWCHRWRWAWSRSFRGRLATVVVPSTPTVRTRQLQYSRGVSSRLPIKFENRKINILVIKVYILSS